MSLDFGVHFRTAAERLKGERDRRREVAKLAMPFCVPFLDDALGGILPHDLILLGARTGAGKTALASMIAQEAARAKRRVHYFALEAEPDEIERRIKYRLIGETLRSGGTSVFNLRRLNYRDWYLGHLDDLVVPIESEVDRIAAEQYETLHTFYRGKDFTISDFTRLVLAVQDQTDLVILDHLHYVDSEDPNENRAYKDIVKGIRDTSLAVGKAVVLVAHLRKRDRTRAPLVPDIDDFHGSSDITKIATKAILLAPGKRKEGQAPHEWPTYMTVAKDRMDGAKPFVAAMCFDARLASYNGEYMLGRAKTVSGVEEFEPVPVVELPRWARNSVLSQPQGGSW